MLTTVQAYTDRDILCGRGGKVNKHAGNRVYRRLVEYKKGLYKTLDHKEDKALLISSIIHALKSEGARFLSQDELTSTWYEIDDSDAIKKTSQAFREPERKSPKAAAVAKRSMKNRVSTVSPSDSDASSWDGSYQDVKPAVSRSAPAAELKPAPAASLNIRPEKSTRFAQHPNCFATSEPVPPQVRQNPLPLREGQQDVANFMEALADKEVRLPSLQSQEFFNELRSISIGDRPITESQYQQEFLRFMRCTSVGDTENASDSNIFADSQERSQFLQLMKSVSGNYSPEDVSRLMRSISSEIKDMPNFTRNDSLDIWSHFMRSLPSTTPDHTAAV